MDAMFSSSLFASPWHWLVIGLLLICAEVFVSGAVLLWFGIAAIVIGLASFLYVMTAVVSLLVWAGLSVMLVLTWQLYRRRRPARQVDHKINQRGEQYVGRHFTLARDIVNGTGELHVDDTRWKIVSHRDLTAGTKVKVVAVVGTSLSVEEFLS